MRRSLTFLLAFATLTACTGELGGGEPSGDGRRAASSGPQGASLQAIVLERAAGIAPQNRPYVYNGVQDCYGFVRQVWNAVLHDGGGHPEDYYPNAYNRARWLGVAGGLPVNDAPSSEWVYFSDPAVLLPGDVLATHQGHAWGNTWHGGIYAGQSGGLHYQWDNTIDSLNGAYKRRLWSGFRYYYRPTHERLGAVEAEPDWPTTRALARLPGGVASLVLDSFGGLTAHDGAPAPSGGPAWDHSIARDVAVLPDGSGGFVLDGFGGLHPFGLGANAAPPHTKGAAYWNGWDIARRLVLLPDGSGGYVLDGFGGIHPFAIGGNPRPPATRGGPGWPGWDIARDLVLLGDGSGGYVLDGWGGIHAFAIGENAIPPAANGGAYWEGWDIARGIVLLGSGAGGHVLDGFGGVHPFGLGAAGRPGYAKVAPYWEGWDIARAIAILPDGSRGLVVDGLGGVHHLTF
jgi:hypothetical protein